MSAPMENSARGTRLHLYVAPRASRTQVVGLHEERVKLQITAPPTEGKANAAIVAFLSKQLSVRKDEITLVSGQTGKRKTVEIEGLSPQEVASRLGVES